MESTLAEDLLSNALFVGYALKHIPAKNLSEFAPDRSLRWLQEVCKTARERGYDPGTSTEDDLTDAPVLPTSSNPELLGRDGPAAVPIWAKTLTKKTFHVPTIDLPRQDQWWRLEGDYALLSDVHIPFHSPSTIERLMTDSDKIGIRKLVIMGDLFDFNMFNHKRGANYSRRAQDDVEVGRGVLKALLECYEEVYVYPGNHDDWLTSHLRMHFDSKFLFSSFFKEMPRVKWSDYGQADVVSGGVKWKLLHGAQFSGTNPLGVAKNYATKYNMNVVLGHQHRDEEGFSNGGYHCVCLGGAYDPDRMGYLHHQPFSAGSPKRSVGLLKDGQVYVVRDV